MRSLNFGYAISHPRAIDMDNNDLRKSRAIIEEMPELQACLSCGSCTASCTAGNIYTHRYDAVSIRVPTRSLTNVCYVANVAWCALAALTHAA